jgi:hypothetical protein
MTKAESQTDRAARKRSRAQLRRAVGLARRPLDAPVIEAHPDVDLLLGESEYSVSQAGERVVSRLGHLPGGPARQEPQQPVPEEIARRFMEELTEAPAHDQYEPEPALELEPEEESDSLPEDELRR